MITTALAAIKRYWSIGLGLLVAGLYASTKYFKAKAKREKKRADEAEAGLEHSIEVLQRDSELDTEFKSRRAKEAAEIEASGASDELSDPNNEWVRHNRNID